MNDAELLTTLDRLKSTMISVSTGGAKIQEVNDSFQSAFDSVNQQLRSRSIENPLPYSDLWDWYGRWSSGDMPTYQSRRTFVNEIFAPLLQRIKTGRKEEFEPTGWNRVDRTVTEIRNRLAQASTEEHFQAVGLLCREVLISTAQAVFDHDQHPTTDGIKASPTDAKRMLEAYIAAVLMGGTNDFLRKHARAALDLAVHLQHRRTASFRDAAICVEATTSVVNLIAIIAGLRDPNT
ncbi:MAG: hypothetical protein A3J24_03110 [Deltaproteobacteria bacterium RIFCSPLOWO2_02_FULL_53_8]|nr:MAG: hypothetical protein A3J24_03110 [Deltaproteobacteria bacterium RIFCSPLOWO2_02_FULL_53_8]